MVKWTFAYGMRPHAKKTKIMTLITGNNSRNTSEQLAREGFTHAKHHALEDPVEIVRAQAGLGYYDHDIDTRTRDTTANRQRHC